MPHIVVTLYALLESYICTRARSIRETYRYHLLYKLSIDNLTRIILIIYYVLYYLHVHVFIYYTDVYIMYRQCYYIDLRN